MKEVECNLGCLHRVIECGIEGCDKWTADTSNVGFYRMTPPLGSHSANADVWVCEYHLNEINFMFGVKPF
jgi:hypothetical protein